MQDLRKIRAWHKAQALSIAIRRLVDRFPKKGYGNLRNQMVRTAESIADNIAEGAGASTSPEFARFLDASIKSTSELESQIDRAHGYGLIGEREWRDRTDEVCTVRKMTWSFRRSVLAESDGPPKTRYGEPTAENG